MNEGCHHRVAEWHQKDADPCGSGSRHWFPHQVRLSIVLQLLQVSPLIWKAGRSHAKSLTSLSAYRKSLLAATEAAVNWGLTFTAKFQFRTQELHSPERHCREELLPCARHIIDSSSFIFPLWISEHLEFPLPAQKWMNEHSTQESISCI